MGITQTDLLLELSEEERKHQNSKEVTTDLQEDQAAPLEHTTLDEYSEIAKEESTTVQRAKWERELLDQAKKAQRLRNLRASTHYDGD